MSVSDTRRGPGWWMDLDGAWNPPEEWPESTPPLPGWTQTFDGRWSPPTDDDGAVRPPTARELAREAVTVSRPRPAHEELDVRTSLSYADYEPRPLRTAGAPPASWALQAAAIAALAALMIGLGIAVLIVA